jgi:hypothetical protein
MRPLVLILLLASCAASRAQDQERKMLDRILRPDMALGNSMQSKAYYGGSGGGGVDLKDANVKDFYFVQKFSSKEFDVRQYSAKSFWSGDFQFSTKAANVKADAAGDKVFASKALPVKDAHEAGKGYAADSRTYATRESPERGKTSQNHLEEMYKGKEQMNIDQVRDLLNKPKL